MNPLFWLQDLLGSESPGGRLLGVLLVILIALAPLLGVASFLQWRRAKRRKARARRRSPRPRRDVRAEDVDSAGW